jgi:hypothetical protein
MNLSTISNAGVKMKYDYIPPQSTVLLEILTVAQLGTKFPASNEIRTPSLSAKQIGSIFQATSQLPITIL